MMINASCSENRLLGYLDTISPYILDGWASINGIAAWVDIVVDGHTIATIKGNRYRSDLLEHNIDPTSGFEFRFSDTLPRGTRVEVRYSRCDELVELTHVTGSPCKVPERSSLTEAGRIETGDATLIYLHIPKTAGTSLIRAIDSQVPGRLRLYGAVAVEPSTLMHRPRIPLIVGHLSYGVHATLCIAPRYATVLRDPVTRVISFLRYVKLRQSSEYGDNVDKSLSEMVRCRFTEQTNNHMCRIIAGTRVDQGTYITDRWLLDLAWHNLTRHFVLVGTVKNISGFQSRLGMLLGCEFAYLYQENIGPTNGGVGDGCRLDGEAEAALPDIESANALDIELYKRIEQIGFCGTLF